MAHIKTGWSFNKQSTQRTGPSDRRNDARRSTRQIQQYIIKNNSNSHLESKRCAGSMVEAKSAYSLRKTRAKLSAPGGHSSSQPPPFSGTPAPPVLKYRPQPPSRTAVYTCALLTPRSAARSGYPRDNLEAQPGRLKHLAAFITITLLACNAAPSPSGRATQHPSVSTSEPQHFGVLISPASPPKALSPRDRRVCLCCPSWAFSGSNRAHIAELHGTKSMPIRTAPSADVEPAAAAPPRWVRCWDIASSGPSYDHTRPRS